MNRARNALLAPIFLLCACAATGRGPGMAAAPVAGSPVTVGIVAFNDFHGNLEPPHMAVPVTGASGEVRPVPAGGAAWLAATIDAVRSRYSDRLTVSAGDLVGASQFTSALFLDEPTIGVMNRIGLDYNAVGNHEFDRGRDELKRIQAGGCRQFTRHQPCMVERYSGARFPFLAANVIEPDGRTLFPASAIRRFGKGPDRVSVGIIGLTLKETGILASPGSLGGLRFADEAETINALVPRLKAQGADAIVVLLHQGGHTTGIPNPDGCKGLSGDIRPILDRLDPRVDLVVSGHTHASYVCDYATVDPARTILLTSAGSYGEEVTDIALEIDPRSHRVVGRHAHNIVVQSPAYRAGGGIVANTDEIPQYAPRADIAAYVAKYAEAAKAAALRPVGTLAGTLGNLIADAQLDATRGAGAQIALLNVFGIRAPFQLIPAADGSVTFSQIHTVQPFDNVLVTQTLTGAEIKAVLEQGFDAIQPMQALAPSHGFAYRYDLSRPVNDRIVAMTLNGVPIAPDRQYRVTTNSFLASGGDSFSLLARQRDAVTGVTDLDALESWLKAVPPRPVPAEVRVTAVRP